MDYNITVIAGSWCPACQQDGGMFHYEKGEFHQEENLHKCEHCLKGLSDEEYTALLTQNPKPNDITS